MALEAHNEIVGEADETETAMAGIEVGDEEIRSQKMLEQVKELVGQDAQAGAQLLNRWIHSEE